MSELVDAINELCEEKEISPDVVLEALEAALVAAYKKNFNAADNVDVSIDRETGKIKVISKKTVVAEPEDPQTEISLEEAQKIDKHYVEGAVVEQEVTPKNFGRIAAMTAKQVVTQRIREAERNVIYHEYSEKIHQVVTGKVARIEHGNVYVDIGKAEAILPVSEQPENESYAVHQEIRCYVSEVRSGTKETQILLSRTHPGLVRKFFEEEVPEIADGTVEIKGIAREGGSRTKIAVYAEDENIDAQGACIGPKGVRVQKITEELNDEKIDIIKWSEDPAEYIAAALSPSNVISTEINEEEKSAHVTVPEYQLSLAIGKSGQNARLAARLTGWKIDISAE